MRKIALTLLALVAIGLFSIFVWPTQWQTRTVRLAGSDMVLRLNRIDGRMEMLTRDGWRPMNFREPTGMERAIAILER